MSPKARRPQFKLSKSMLNRLPKEQRAGAAEHLWEKSGGLCALCDGPLPSDPKEIQADHRVALQEGQGGDDSLDNLYLACKSCNQIRSNLPFDLGHQIVRFVVWIRTRTGATFDDVLDRYVEKSRKKTVFDRKVDRISLTAEGIRRTSEVFIDPATSTPYFFTEIPITHIYNDTDSQPRDIIDSHVRALAIDFYKRPVHEPSNCRLVMDGRDFGRLLQFDGQHKTTAQIVLERTNIPMKVYIEPDPVMLQKLVLQIQQGIKKLPLSTSDTLRKLKDVMEDRLDAYTVGEGETRSESGFLESQPREEQKAVRKQLMLELQRMVLDDTKLKKYVSKGKSKFKPLTDTVAVAKLIKPLIYPEPLEENLAAKNSRDYERENIVFVLDEITKHMLEKGWKTGASEVDRRRAQNFLYQGSIGWWMNRVLKPAIGTALHLGMADRERLLVRQLKAEQKLTVARLVSALCAWPIWTNPKPVALKAMRSNTAKDVEAAFPTYTDVKLVQDLAK